MIMRLESTILVCFVFCTGIGRLSTAFSVSTMSMAQQTVSSSSSSSSSSSLLLPLPLSLNVQQTLDPCVIVMKRMIAEYSHLWEDKGGVLSLAQGVVYWDPPPTVQEALSEALLDPLLHSYCPDEGLPELKSAVETKLAMENGLHHHRALITIGANQAYMNVVLTLLAGHKAIVFRPYYFNHVMAIQLVAGDDHVVIGPCTNDDDGVPDANWLNNYLDQADSTVSMVTITNPGNPTGVSLSRDQLREYVQITKKHNVWLVLDCTYEHFDHLHGSETFECFEDEHIIHIFSFSKGYALAGFRCGYVVLHEKSTNAYSQMRKVQDTIPICPPRISQWAALGALRVPRQWVLNQIQTLDPSREHLLSALSCLSQVMGGSGAMYIMGKLPDGMNDKDTCETLVKEYGIAIIPGSFCGFPGWIRVCYSNLRPDKCMEAAARLKQGLEHLCIELPSICTTPQSSDAAALIIMSSSNSESDDDESDETEEEEEEEFREDMRVFLRLRPMNKLETSRRSKNCVDLSEDPSIITVDSPLEGEFDFTFDHVFEEYASQEEVYEHALQDVPEKLIEGFNCTVMAYGQTGTGKTHTMMGVNGGSDGLIQLWKRENSLRVQEMTDSSRSLQGGPTASISPSVAQSIAESAVSIDEAVASEENGEVNPEAEGMILKVVAHVFEKMAQASSSTEFIVRCSYVEIYLEKILDLLHPQGGTSIALTIEKEADKAAGVGNHVSNVKIVGASELCCFDVGDVCALLARGNAWRTRSATQMNTDSSRSHAIFSMRIEQLDRITSQTTTSTLQMLDLAGSELAANPGGSARSNAASSTAVQVEAKMINKSLNALQKMIRVQLENQRGAMISFDAAVRQSKLTRLLRPSFGGNCLTTMILTASPSSYNIGETISTIRFGQRCRKVMNQPKVTVEDSAEVCRQRLFESEKKNEDTMALVRILANKCQTLHVGTGEPATGPLWETIENITSEDDDEALDFKVTVQRRRYTGESDMFERQISSDTAHSELTEKLNEKIDTLEEELRKTAKARDDAENTLAELQSEVAVLRTQNENLTADKKRIVTDIMESKNEVQILSQRKLEVEHNLRTSQFRENEAIVFLRQFRRFYTNVLKDKAAHGAGSIKGITTEITHKVQNAPDLNKLRDIDEMLFEAGLLEEHEMGEDRSSAAYKPSKDSLMRSAAAASRAARVEAELKSPDSNSINGVEAALVTGTSMGVIRNFTGVGQLEAISEMDAGVSAADVDLHRSRESLNDSFEALHDSEGNSLSADADAGAGISEVLDCVTPTHSISRAAGTGLMVTRQQKVLRTPSGRLTMMREKDLEKELMEMSERCIELQMALNEEKAIVDALTNKAGGSSKKKIAQEAISLREQLDKKTASLTAIAWKMNELNLINKTYNEKMVSREQHVMYLEENLFEMQENNRRATLERQESEKKLRDEIDQLIKVVEGTTMPLWQFGEAKIDSRPLASRILLPVAGSQQEDEPNERRFSLGALESDVDEGLEADARSNGLPHASKVKTKDCETQTDGANIESANARVGDLYKETQNGVIALSGSGIHPSLIQSLPERSGVGESGRATVRESDSIVQYNGDQESYDNDSDPHSDSESNPEDPEPVYARVARAPTSTTDSVQSLHASEENDDSFEKNSTVHEFGDDAVKTGAFVTSSQNSQDVTTNSQESDGSNRDERFISPVKPRITAIQQTSDQDESDFESDSDVEPKPIPRFSESDSYSESESDTYQKPFSAPFQRPVSEGENYGSSENMAVVTGGRDSATTDVAISNKVESHSPLESTNESEKEESDGSGAENASLEPGRPHNAAFEEHSDGDESEYEEVDTSPAYLQSASVDDESDGDESESDVESDSKKYHQNQQVMKSGIAEVLKGKIQPMRSVLSEYESESEPEVDPVKTNHRLAALNHAPKGSSSESVDDDEDDITDDSGPGVGKQWVDGVPPPLHGPVRQPSSASVSLNDGLGLNDDFDYDDLGKKWGMSESEIAEDAAILTPRRRNSEDMAPPASTALAAALNDTESNNSDEDSINWGPGSTPEIAGKVVKDVKPVTKGWRSGGVANPKPSTVEHVTKGEKECNDEDSIDAFPDKGNADDASYDDDSDDNDTYDESIKKLDEGADSSFSEEGNEIHNSLNEDDFDKMMGEAAAALAAAEEFIPSDDDSLEPNNDSYKPMDKKKFGNDDSDASPDAKKPAGNPQRVENYNNRPSDLRRLTEEQLKGGKSIGYSPKRFVEKLGPWVKSAVSKGGNKSLLPEYDDFSVSVAPDSQSVSLSVSHSIRERQLPVAEERKTKNQSKPEKESKKSASVSKHKSEETKKRSSRKDKERSSSRKPSAKEATVSSRSKSKSRHTRDEDGEKKKIRSTRSSEDLKKKKSSRKIDDDKKKKAKSPRGDEDEKKKSKKKKSDIAEEDVKKKKKAKKTSEDGERPRSRESRS